MCIKGPAGSRGKPYAERPFLILQSLPWLQALTCRLFRGLAGFHVPVDFRFGPEKNVPVAPWARVENLRSLALPFSLNNRVAFPFHADVDFFDQSFRGHGCFRILFWFAEWKRFSGLQRFLRAYLTSGSLKWRPGMLA
jgi:hypothetical protein